MKTHILVPCYKRPEYTAKCIDSLERAQEYPDAKFYLWDDGSQDGTTEILHRADLPKEVFVEPRNVGLRNVLINFIEKAEEDTQYLSVVGNDCLMPLNWLNGILNMFDASDLEIISPNVYPSNAAFKFGADDTNNLGYRRSKIVGGLWTMRKNLVDGIYFERFNSRGIVGAFHILNQVLAEKSPKVAWMPSIIVQDLGHWSGKHPDHISSPEHRAYSAEVGRPVAW